MTISELRDKPAGARQHPDAAADSFAAGNHLDYSDVELELDLAISELVIMRLGSCSTGCTRR